MIVFRLFFRSRPKLFVVKRWTMANKYISFDVNSDKLMTVTFFFHMAILSWKQSRVPESRDFVFACCVSCIGRLPHIRFPVLVFTPGGLKRGGSGDCRGQINNRNQECFLWDGKKLAEGWREEARASEFLISPVPGILVVYQLAASSFTPEMECVW